MVIRDQRDKALKRPTVGQAVGLTIAGSSVALIAAGVVGDDPIELVTGGILAAAAVGVWFVF